MECVWSKAISDQWETMSIVSAFDPRRTIWTARYGVYQIGVVYALS